MQSFTYPLAVLHPHPVGASVRVNDFCPLRDVIGQTGIVTDRFYSNLAMAVVRLRLTSGAELTLFARSVTTTPNPTVRKGN